MGLYFNISIVLFYIPLIAICFVIRKIHNTLKKREKKPFKLISLKRYFRYIKLIINLKLIIFIIIFSIISNSIVILKNYRFNNLYKDKQCINGEAIVLSDKIEKENYYIYKIKVLYANASRQYKNTYLYLRENKKSTKVLEYGDKINFIGEFLEPNSKRNYKGFDYKEYLKTLNIYGTIKIQEINIIEKNKVNFAFNFAHKISNNIKQKIEELTDKKSSSLIKGILLGDTSSIDEEIEDSFRASNISHILAVSGMHVYYIVLGIQLLGKLNFGKQKTRFIIILFLIIYMFMTGFAVSVVRASIMAIISIVANMLYRRNDTFTTISISLGLILLYNPFLITNIGLQFSYIGTIGIIIFHKNMLKFLKSFSIKNPKFKYKFNKKVILAVGKIKEIIAVTLSAQLAILPITIYQFNTFGIYFLFTNLLISVIIGPIIILSSLVILLSYILSPIAQIFLPILKGLIFILTLVSKISKLPFSEIMISTPKILLIIIYYILILIINYIYSLYNLKKLNYTQLRIRNIIALTKYKIRLNKIKYVKYSCSFILILIIIFFTIPKKLEINFIDVGQGDSTFIITPKNQTILIDGGGSLSKDYDVGKNTLLPYILDKGYTKIDYIFISHFDQDHIGGLLTILKKLKVGKVIISKQIESSQNYKEFLSTVKEKKIKVEVVKAGEKLIIEDNIYFDILWPKKDEEISENAINNNSIVMKMYYKEFSILFTGDIEEIAENKILELYKGQDNKLISNVLKVAHHGSKTSSKKEILDKINPQVALIGVGKNNLFKHPSDETIENLKKFNTFIYRTDKNGEITLQIDKDGKYFINTIY